MEDDTVGIYHRYAPLRIENTLCYGLVDSGNSIQNAISPALFHRLGLKVKRDLEPYHISSVGTAKKNASLRILGRLKKPLKINIGQSRHHFKTRPIVVDGLSMSFNLSGPFLAKNGIDQIHTECSLRYKDMLLPLFSRQGVKEIQSLDVTAIRTIDTKLYITRDMEVTPNSISIMPLSSDPEGNPNTSESGDAIIIGNIHFASATGLHPTTGTLGRWKEGLIHSTVLNTLDRTVHLKKGQIYGEAKPASPQTGEIPGTIAYLDKPGAREELPTTSTTEDKLRSAKKTAKRTWLKEQFKLEEGPFIRDQPERLEAALQLLERFYHLFSQGGKYGKTDLVQHEICTPDIPPIKCKGRPINPILEQDLKEQVNTWLEQDVVQPSNSPWNFPLIPVPKKNGKTRWVVDYRRLNEVTMKDSFPLPNIEDNLSRLSTSKIFSGIDGAGAFHVVSIREQDRAKTAFSTPWGLFEFVCMPFGLTNAPATYSRLVQKVLEGIPTNIALPYLDDTCIHTESFDEHLEALERVFQAHENAGLTLQPPKCQLFQPSIEYLGHVVSARGITPIPKSLAIIKDWPYPETVTQLRTFLGKTNYYRKFVPEYAKIIGPLAESLKGAVKKKQPIKKTPASEKAFETLKEKLMNSPILAYPQFWSEEPFILDTDWSREHNAIGGVLSQKQDGHERVILFGAKRLNETQANYSSNKGEIFAAIHFIRAWKYYLTQRKFVLRTDHQAMKWIQSMEEPQGMILRWLETLSKHLRIIPCGSSIDHIHFIA